LDHQCFEIKIFTFETKRLRVHIRYQIKMTKINKYTIQIRRISIAISKTIVDTGLVK